MRRSLAAGFRHALRLPRAREGRRAPRKLTPFRGSATPERDVARVLSRRDRAARSHPRAFSPTRCRRAGAIPEDGWINGFDPEFSRRLGAGGWIGMTWPRAYGGGARNYVERAIVTEELLRAGAPTAAHWVGDRQIGPALLAHGTEEQKREIIPAHRARRAGVLPRHERAGRRIRSRGAHDPGGRRRRRVRRRWAEGVDELRAPRRLLLPRRAHRSRGAAPSRASASSWSTCACRASRCGRWST